MLTKEDLEFWVSIKVLTKGQAKEFSDIATKIKSAQQQIDRLSQETENFTNEMQKAKNASESLKVKMTSDLREIKNQIVGVDNEIKKSAKERQKIDKELIETKKKTAKIIRESGNASLKELQTKMRLHQASYQEKEALLKVIGVMKTQNILREKKAFLTSRESQLLAQKDALEKKQISTASRYNAKIVESKNATNTLNKKIADNRIELSKVNREMTQNEKRVGRSSAEYRKMASTMEKYGFTVDRSAKNVFELNRQLDEKQRALLRSRIALDKSVKGIKEFGKIGESTFSTTLRTIRRIVTTMITLGAVFFFRNLIKQGIEFENMMIRVGAIAGATAENFSNMVGSIRRIARETIFTASEVATTSQVLAQAGFSVREVLTSLEPILKLTTATMGELKQTAELTVAILRTFDLDVKNTIDVVNVLTEATISSRADIERLATAFRFAGPAGAAFNQSVETTVASLSKFIDMGLSASIAGTTFRRALIQLSQGTARQIKILQKLNLRFEEVNPSLNDFGRILQTLAKTTLTASGAIQLFGARAGASIFTMIKRIREGGKGIIEFTQQLADAKELNRVDQIYAKVLGSMRSQFLITKSAMEDMALTLFQVFRPALSEIILKARDAFLALNEELKTDTGKNFQELLISLIPIVGAVFDAIQKVIKAFAFIIMIITKLTASFSPLKNIMQTLVVFLTVMAAKTIFFNKFTVNLVKTLFNAGLALKGFAFQALATRQATATMANGVAQAATSITIFGKTVTMASFAVKGFHLALSTIFIPAAIAFLPTFFGWIASAISGTSNKTEQFGEIMEENSAKINFSTEQLQKYSDQIGIQIENEEHLTRLLREKQVIMGEIEGHQAGLLKLEFPDLERAFLQSKDLSPLEKANSLLKSMSGSAKEIEITMKKFGNDLNKLEVPFKTPVGSVQTVPSGVNLFMEYDELLKSAAEKIANQIPNLGKESARRFISNFAKGISDGDFNEIFTKISGYTGNALGNLIESDPSLKRALEKIGSKMGVESTRAVAEMINAGGKAAKVMQQIMENFANQNKSAFVGALAQIGKTKEAIEEIGDSFRSIAGNSNLIIKKQEELNKHIKTFRNTNDNIVERRKQINNLRDKAITLLKKANKEEEKQDDFSKKQAMFTRAQANEILFQIKNYETLLEKIVDENNSLGLIIEKWQRISAQTKEARILEKLRLEEIKMEEHEQLRISELLRNQNKDFERSLGLTDSLLKNVDFMQTGFKNIGNEMAIVKDEISFDKSLTVMKDLNKQLYEQDVIQRKILALNTELEQTRHEIATEFTRMTGISTDVLDDFQEAAELTGRSAELANKEFTIKKAMTEEVKLGNEILKIRIAINQELNKTQEDALEIVKQISEERRKENLPQFVSGLISINDKYEQQKNLLEGNVKFLKNAFDANQGNSKVQLRIVDLLNEQQSALDILSKRNKEQLKTSMDLFNIDLKRQKANSLSVIGAASAAQLIKEQADAEEKAYEARKTFEKVSSAEGIKWLQTLGLSREEIYKIIDAQGILTNELEIMANGNYFEKVGQGVRGMIADLTAVDAATQTIDSIKSIGSEMKKIADDLITEALQKEVYRWFGIESEAVKKLADIERQWADDRAKIWRDYFDKVEEENIQHRMNMNDINNRFDQMTREREDELYNERVERMMSLAALEQNLRLQGLTQEEERANLLRDIDINLASSRIGTIEERQIKLAALEEKIKALNTLENTLGLTRTEIEQSSIARLGDLQKATSDFYQDKRTEALATIQTERKAEIDAEQQRHQMQLDRLAKERDRALEEAKITRDRAKAEVDAEQSKTKKLKEIGADFTVFAIKEIGKILIAKLLSSTQAKTKEITSATGSVIRQEGIALAKVTSLYAPLGPFAPAAIAGHMATLAPSFGLAHGMAANPYFKGGAIKEQRKAAGGLISGPSGIDNIHANLPVGAYIVNKASTKRHRSELDIMAARNASRNYKKYSPAAVTSGEYYMPPPAAIQYRSRLDQINKDKTGRTVETNNFSGGTIRGYQLGGAVEGVGVSKSINISVVNDFSGVNILSGESEAAVADFYQTHIRKNIQEDLNNNAIYGA